MYDCTANVGSIECSAEFAGGFAGSISLGYDLPVIVDNCRCEINSLNSRSWAGGFAGSIGSGLGYVANCQAFVNGDITVTEMPPWEEIYLPSSRVGGFVGDAEFTVIINCFAKFNRLSGTGTYVGGLVGEGSGSMNLNSTNIDIDSSVCISQTGSGLLVAVFGSIRP